MSAALKVGKQVQEQTQIIATAIGTPKTKAPTIINWHYRKWRQRSLMSVHKGALAAEISSRREKMQNLHPSN
jgi:hypothetical protein